MRHVKWKRWTGLGCSARLFIVNVVDALIVGVCVGTLWDLTGLGNITTHVIVGPSREGLSLNPVHKGLIIQAFIPRCHQLKPVAPILPTTSVMLNVVSGSP